MGRSERPANERDVEMQQVVKKSQFTLVEIIAVLLVIGIMAAVAIPKFVNIATEAKQGIAQAGINEAKATFSVAYAKAYLANAGGAVTAANVITASGISSPATFGDVSVTFVADAQDIDLTATYDGGPTVTDTFTVP